MTLKNQALHAVLGLSAALLSACSVDVQMTHEPAVATSRDVITFTTDGDIVGSPSSLTVEMYVDGALVETCTSLPCTHVGGPYPGFENEWLGYHVETTAVINSNTYQDTDLGYTGITETDYSWKADAGAWFVPVRWGDWTWLNTNVLLSKAEDYDTTYADPMSAFMGDIDAKMNDVLWPKEEIFTNLEDLNVYAYRKTAASATGCGQPHADATTDASWATDHGILHVANFGDCTSGFSRFSAEGPSNTQAFLHEFSHSIFELADEYDGPTYYFQAANEPNIFETEALCRAEQTLKNRDPDDCYEFTAGWWGTHTGTTVMTNGLFSHPWSTESVERLQWWFDNN